MDTTTQQQCIPYTLDFLTSTLPAVAQFIAAEHNSLVPNSRMLYAQRLESLGSEITALLVLAERLQGNSWAKVAETTRMNSPQAAHKRYHGRAVLLYFPQPSTDDDDLGSARVTIP